MYRRGRFTASAYGFSAHSMSRSVLWNHHPQPSSTWCEVPGDHRSIFPPCTLYIMTWAVLESRHLHHTLKLSVAGSLILFLVRQSRRTEADEEAVFTCKLSNKTSALQGTSCRVFVLQMSVHLITAEHLSGYLQILYTVAALNVADVLGEEGPQTAHQLAQRLGTPLT